jgi:hypothetical protein
MYVLTHPRSPEAIGPFTTYAAAETHQRDLPALRNYRISFLFEPMAALGA